MKTLRSAFLLAFTLFSLLLPSQVSAQTKWTGTCVHEYDKSGNAVAGGGDVATIQGLECLIGNVLATFVTLLGIAAFVMFLVGSFQYLTAGSNSKGVQSGANSITFAIVGIVLALASFVILRFISDFTGITTILSFQILQLP